MAGVSVAGRFLSRYAVVGFLLALVVSGGSVRAQVGSDRYSSMVIDAQTGQVISSANPDEYRFPASLTKMMTIYMVFDAVRDRRLSFNDVVPVSSWASSMPPTKLGLVPGTQLTVEQALLSLVTKSANDAAAALGELLGGDEDRFAQMMTLRAHALGMSRTTFRNASGLPDWGQVTTAHDLVVLARHLLQDFPQYYSLFSTPSFQFHGRTVINHQAMLRTYPGADGMKTGYTEASGYNVVTSAVRGNVRLIGVVMGASNGWERDLHMAALLDQGFLRQGVAPVEVVRREPFYRLPLVGSARAAPMPAMAETVIPRGKRPVRERVSRRGSGRAVAGKVAVAPVPPMPSRERRAVAGQGRPAPHASGGHGRSDGRSGTRAAGRGSFGAGDPRG